MARIYEKIKNSSNADEAYLVQDLENIGESKSFVNVFKKAFKKLMLFLALAGVSLTTWPFVVPTQFNNISQNINRLLEKKGIISVEEKAVEIAEPITKQINYKDGLQQYKKSLTYTQIIGAVKDERSPAPKDSLVMMRNQFLNEDGYNYKAGAVKSRSNQTDAYYNVAGVMHFMILDDFGVDFTSRTTMSELNAASKEFKKRIGKDIKITDYVPVATIVNRKQGIVNIKYKEAKDVLPTDIAVTKLVQWNAADINFNNSVSASAFGFSPKSNIRALTDKSGNAIPSLLFKNMKAFSRFSGASVVLLFKDTMGNVIARDFSGSLHSLNRELENITSSFGISRSTITVGVYDAGSYTGKPKAKDGTVYYSQYSGFNQLHPNSAGSLMIRTESINETVGRCGL